MPPTGADFDSDWGRAHADAADADDLPPVTRPASEGWHRLGPVPEGSPVPPPPLPVPVREGLLQPVVPVRPQAAPAAAPVAPWLQQLGALLERPAAQVAAEVPRAVLQEQYRQAEATARWFGRYVAALQARLNQR